MRARIALDLPRASDSLRLMARTQPATPAEYAVAALVFLLLIYLLIVA